MYLAGMFQTWRSDSKQLSANLSSFGNYNAFPSIPKSRKVDWDLVQDADVDTLRYCIIKVGNAKIWRDAVNGLYDEEVETMHDLLCNLRKGTSAKNRVCPTTHATCVLMPSQKLMKCLVKRYSHLSRDEIREIVEERADNYWKFFVEKNYMLDVAPEKELHRSVAMYGSFHLLEALPNKWGDEVYFKCNCIDYFHYGVCSNSLLLGMVVDRTLTVPRGYLKRTLQERKKRGRPAVSLEVMDDELELEKRDKAKLSSTRSEYKHPTVICIHFCYNNWY